MLRALLWFDAPIAALAASSVVALGVAWEKHSALQAARWLWAGVVIYALLSRLVRTERVWRAVATLCVATGTVIAFYVVLQFPYLGYDVKVAALSRIGRSTGSLLPRFALWAPMPNSVATLLEGLVPLAAALAIARGGLCWRLAAATGGLVMLLAVALVASRGAWVALGAGTLVCILAWAWAERTRLAGKLIAIMVVGLLAGVTAVNLIAPSNWAFPLTELFDRPDRLNVYRNSLVLIQSFPFTGIGPGDQFAMALSRYALLIQVPFLTYAHNLYLSMWLELGLPGMISLVALVGAVLAAVLVGERAGLGILFRGAWAGILVALVHGLMDARQTVDRWTVLPLFILLGLLAATLKQQRSRVTAGAAALPIVAMLAFPALASPFLLPLGATWQANQGMLAEARAELGGLPPASRIRELADARRYFEAALRLNPRQPTARRRLGLMAIDDGRFEDAHAHLQIAWQADNGNPATRKAFGLACAWTGRLELGKDLLAPVDGIVEELNVWSWHWEQRGRRAQAIYAARLSLMMLPSSPEVARRLADLEHR